MQELPEEKDKMNGENTAEKQVELAGGCYLTLDMSIILANDLGIMCDIDSLIFR